MEDEKLENFINSMSHMYDTDAIEIDYANNNFNIDDGDVESYYKPRIIAESVINGQLKQAREQAKSYDTCPNELSDYLNPDQIAQLF